MTELEKLVDRALEQGYRDGFSDGLTANRGCWFSLKYTEDVFKAYFKRSISWRYLNRNMDYDRLPTNDKS